MLACVSDSDCDPGMCITIVGLFCTVTLVQVFPGSKDTSVWYVPPTDSTAGVGDPPPHARKSPVSPTTAQRRLGIGCLIAFSRGFIEASAVRRPSRLSVMHKASLS